MSWTTTVVDLRTLLSDGDTDKLRYRKRVFGECNGTNTHFKTFEFRRISDFTTVASPLGVYKNGVLQANADISSDFTQTGDFTLVAAPIDGDVVEASYYVQWFIDNEIMQFARLAANWLGLGDDYTQVSEGLRPSALKYAASEAYQKLALRWAENLAEGFQLNDAPKKEQFAVVDTYRKMAADYRKDAEAVRDDFYSRSGREKQPLFGTNVGRVVDNVPKR